MKLYQVVALRVIPLVLALFISACNDTNTAKETVTATAAKSNLQFLEVYKNPSCGCCKKWMSHIEKHGFEASSHNLNNLPTFKSEKGIQPQYQSCHTAVSQDGYVFEGHIPAKYIHQFLKEKPEGALGLTVPAMPVGSPGMEVGDKFMPYQVFLLKIDGSVETYAEVNSQEEQY
ncbi:MAG: hypothetical protein CMP47_10420 [Rickettsiales bacterium]|nr:hypothetical protein [Rickettsiales bacterium]